MDDARWHPASRIFPLMEPDDLEELIADIKAHGLLNPVVMHGGQVLDGRNRLLACHEAGIEPTTVEWRDVVKDGHVSPVEWVIAHNLKRRHLTSSQLAVIALDVLPLLEAEAKERMREGGRKKGGQPFAYPRDEGKAASRLAKQLGTNRTYINQVKKIQATAPELIEGIFAGTQSVPAALEKVARPKAKATKTSKHVGAPLPPADMTAVNDTGAALSIALDHLCKVTLRCIAREGSAAYEVPVIVDAWIFLVEYGFTRPELDKPHATGADEAME